MNKELFVSSTPHETKVGLVEDDLLAEIYLERENEYTLAGSIYKGRVTRVTDVVPANRGVQDLRPQPVRTDATPAAESSEPSGGEIQQTADTDEGTLEADTLSEGQPQASASEGAEPGNGDSSRERDKWRGRRRRRGR